jgi:imidazolonepropionase-like amidohydrolase
MKHLLLGLAPLIGGDGEVVVVRDVTVVDVQAASAEEARLPGRTVVLADGRVRALGLDAEVPVPEGATLVDGTGRTLIPGLFDMHVHLGGLEDEVLTLMIVHGVTSARDLGGDLEELDAALARVEAGALVGPRVARAGYVLENRGWLDRVLAMEDARSAEETEFLRRTRIGLANEDDVLEAVARVYESGADVLKFRNTPPPHLFRFLMEEARLAGLRIAGHEPNSIDLLEAVTLGMGSLEHLPIDGVMRGTSPERWSEISAAMVEHGVHVDPTFVAMQGRRLTADELAAALAAEREDPRWELLPPSLVASWDAGVAERRAENSSIDWKELSARGEAIVRSMHDAGVPFLAGTDLGVPFVYPGAGLHDELVELVTRAGLTPLEALRAATADAAAWLGWERLGSIRVGNEADLVLLEADPLEDVANVGRIHTVFSRGVRHGPEELERLRAAAAAWK